MSLCFISLSYPESVFIIFTGSDQRFRQHLSKVPIKWHILAFENIKFTKCIWHMLLLNSFHVPSFCLAIGFRIIDLSSNVFSILYIRKCFITNWRRLLQVTILIWTIVNRPNVWKNYIQWTPPYEIALTSEEYVALLPKFCLVTCIINQTYTPYDRLHSFPHSRIIIFRKTNNIAFGVYHPQLSHKHFWKISHNN